MTRTRSDLNQIRLNAMDILSKNPDITGAELSRRLGVHIQTAYRHKKVYNAMVQVATVRVAKEIDEKTKDGGDIWLIVKKFLKIK